MFTLTVLGLLTVVVSSSAFAALLGYRLFVNIFASGVGVRQGLSNWVTETRARLGLPVSPEPPAYRSPPMNGKAWRE